MSSKNMHIKKLNLLKYIFFLLIFLIIIIFLIFHFIKINNSQSNIMINLINQDIADVNDLLSKYDLNINISYEYNSEYDKDRIISQSIEQGTKVFSGDNLNLSVSLGEIDLEKLKNDGINELGNVPIMMYHGIKNLSNSETSYTGGNVDKDGYTRTAEAFRNDLEMYYQKGYRMIKLSDYINGVIDVEYGYSPIILTFDDGNDNNILVTGLDSDGNIIIDKSSAVGILEEFKQKYPDFNVTAIFFVTDSLFNQPEYNEKILTWLIDNGYEIGNHTKGHNDFTKIDTVKSQEVVGYMYQKLTDIIGNNYSKIVALPYGSPYNKTHENYQYILSGEYNGTTYETVAALRVGWEPETSPFNISFDKTFLKRCRAYDNNGEEFDIEMTFKRLEGNRFISDGNPKTITTSQSNQSLINLDTDLEVILYD